MSKLRFYYSGYEQTIVGSKAKIFLGPIAEQALSVACKAFLLSALLWTNIFTKQKSTQLWLHVRGKTYVLAFDASKTRGGEAQGRANVEERRLAGVRGRRRERT